MSTVFANRALLSSGWADNVRLTHQHGKITDIRVENAPQTDDIRVDTLLPALSNLHSHTFQRAMAGMTERRDKGRDSFWSWRNLMYQFMDHITPDQYQAIAALAFMEMQEAGYAAVGEFHYVHHQPGGAPYDTLTELSDRVFASAIATGIGLTHLPVLYTYGGAGKAPMAGGQMRFANDIDRFGNLVANARKTAIGTMPHDTAVGIAPHSLRATCPEDLTIVQSVKENAPLHIHIAEQPKEVEDIQAWLGARPVEWLLDNAPVNADWCLIHATHMTKAETRNMAKSGAIAGLCPITESNLGDGPFNGPQFLAHGGRFGVGSDSNVRIALSEELRTLEYSQRLRDLSRNVMISGEGSVGALLYQGAAIGGARALGRDAGRIETGVLADLVAIDTSHPTLCTLSGDALIDGFIFAADDRVVTDVWSAGRHRVQSGRHVAHDQIVSDYKAAVSTLLLSL